MKVQLRAEGFQTLDKPKENVAKDSVEAPKRASSIEDKVTVTVTTKG